MTRADYMTILSHNLRRLPKEDYDRAIEYFEEYFNEAGPAHEQEAIGEPPRTVRRGFHAVWVGILGVCAAPIALPLLLALFCVIFALVITVAAVLGSLFLTAVCLVGGAAVGLAGGFALTFRTFTDGIATIGLSFVTLGIGILCVYGSFRLCRWALRKMSQSLGNIIKGGRRHENKHE